FVAEWRLKADRAKSTGADQVLLEIPANVNELRRTDILSAKAWQDRIREACQSYFAAGYVVTDFVEGHYILEKE
ncbi:MAG: hypothetical protein DMG17_21245, partial [Acidobacteria bacterium]